jgi:hypothetical protein
MAADAALAGIGATVAFQLYRIHSKILRDKCLSALQAAGASCLSRAASTAAVSVIRTAYPGGSVPASLT